MSLEPNPRRNDYTGDGSTSTYDYDFPISDKSELLVKTLDTDYIESTLTLDTDYSVSGVDDDDGGSITLLIAPLGSGILIAIIGRKPIEQQNNIGNQGAFRPDIIEEEFDNLTKVDQEQQEQIGRSFKITDAIKASSFNTELSADILDPANAGRSLIINSTNDGLELGAPATGGGNAESYDNISADATLSATTRNNFCDVSGGSITLTMPDPSASIGRAIDVYNINDGSSNTVTINGAIDGGVSDVLAGGESRTYKSNGIEWRTRS